MSNTINPTQYLAIMQRVLDMAASVDPIMSGQPGKWAGVKLWELPTADQLNDPDTGGYPYLAVRMGENIGSAVGGLLMSNDQGARQPSYTEPVWAIDIYSLHPYDEDNPNYEDAASDMVNLWLLFMEDDLLQGPFDEGIPTVYSTFINRWTPTYVEVDDQRVPCTAAYLQLYVFEALSVSFDT